MDKDWATLMEPKATAERQQMSGQHLAKAASDWLDQMKTLANEELQRVVVEAQKEADNFWAENHYQRTHGNQEEKESLARGSDSSITLSKPLGIGITLFAKNHIPCIFAKAAERRAILKALFLRLTNGKRF